MNKNENHQFKGFIKETTPTGKVSSHDKVVLIRRGNEYFNAGEIEKASRIFMTVGYSDGIIRIGDYYYRNNEPLKALNCYKMAPDREKADEIISDMVNIIRNWIKE